MKRLIAIAAVCAVALPLGSSLADSGECSKSSHTQLPVAQEGFSFAEDGDVAEQEGTVYVCNNGMTVPEPATGHAEVGGSLSDQEGHVYIDGNEGNAAASDCADGYFRIDLTTGAPTFYNEPNGRWASTHEKKDAAKFAQDAAADCQ